MDFIIETKGSGGWPLICILMPDTISLYAGTYFQTNEWMQLINRFTNFQRKVQPQQKKYIYLQ